MCAQVSEPCLGPRGRAAPCPPSDAHFTIQHPTPRGPPLLPRALHRPQPGTQPRPLPCAHHRHRVQACKRLPETGTTDERTWKALLGPSATPADLANIKPLNPKAGLEFGSDSEDTGFDNDMEEAREGRVWLLGEQRWERRPR